MQILYPRCAGLDVPKDSVVARVRCVSAPPVDETRSFATTTAALIELQEWLSTHAVTHVAMEATGVYWKPVWHLLEEHFELVLANAQHIRNVPGRKTDVNDAAWIAAQESPRRAGKTLNRTATQGGGTSVPSQIIPRMHLWSA